jgi:putative ABC transport system ATP-binding protein
MPPLTELRDVSVVFSTGAMRTTVLQHLRLTIEAGDYIVVIGPNGAGKSTLVNTIAGSVHPTRGSVHFRGKDVTALPDYQRARWVGRVFQDPSAVTCAGLSVIEHAALAGMRGRTRSPFRQAVTRDHVITFRELVTHYGRDLEDRLNQDVATLSGGQRQLLSVIMAVSSNPAILLLDEHTSALDPEIGHQVMQRTDAIIRSQHITTVMVTHNMRLAAQYGDRLLVMNAGHIADDVRGSEKTSLDEERLITRFRERAGVLSDRLLS